MKFGFDYLIGDPTQREKLNRWVRVAVRSVVVAFAFIGVCALLFAILQIMAW